MTKRLFSTLCFAILILGFSNCSTDKAKQSTNEQTNYYTDMDNQLKIIAEINLTPGSAKAMRPIFEKVIAGSQAEEGCIYYDLHKNIADTTDTQYVMIEVWKDQEAIDAHNESQHFKTFKQSAGDYIDSMKVTIVQVTK